jgi:glutamate synthase domain-containing protein 2
MLKDQRTTNVKMAYTTYEQKKEQTKMWNHQRNSVSFSDDVTTHVIPKLNACETSEVYYSRRDYKKFQMAQRMREDKHEAKQMRRMIEDESATREAHARELAEMQPPVDDLLLVQPPSMPVRQVSSSLNFAPAGMQPPVDDLLLVQPPSMPVRQVSSPTNFTPVALSRRPGLPARQAASIVTDIWTPNVKVLEPRKGPPTRPVRQASKMNVNDMEIEQNAFPESLGSLLDLALAA